MQYNMQYNTSLNGVFIFILIVVKALITFKDVYEICFQQTAQKSILTSCFDDCLCCRLCGRNSCWSCGGYCYYWYSEDFCNNKLYPVIHSYINWTIFTCFMKESTRISNIHNTRISLQSQVHSCCSCSIYFSMYHSVYYTFVHID